MTDRKRTKEQERRYIELMIQADQNEREFRDLMLKRRQVPGDWHRLHETAPCVPRKRSLTIRLDEDMIRFFRGLGRGYQARMNGVLRAYMLAVLSKEIEGPGDRDWKGDAV